MHAVKELFLVKLGLLISGRGSNMQAILESINTKKLQAEVSIVISSNPEAKGLQTALDFGIETTTINSSEHKSKHDYEKTMVKVLQNKQVDLVILAGYMKLLGDPVINAYPNKILNIHPSLLPSFKGLNAPKQALDYGVKISGCTVHYVDHTLDGGRIVFQQAVKVQPDDTEETLSNRILKQEHLLYPKAIQYVINTGEY